MERVGVVFFLAEVIPGRGDCLLLTDGPCCPHRFTEEPWWQVYERKTADRCRTGPGWYGTSPEQSCQSRCMAEGVYNAPVQEAKVNTPENFELVRRSLKGELWYNGGFCRGYEVDNEHTSSPMQLPNGVCKFRGAEQGSWNSRDPAQVGAGELFQNSIT